MPRPKKTEEEHRLTGTKSQAKEQTPSVFPAGRPKCPGHLCEEAKREWKRVSKILGARGTETSGDFAILAVYAEVCSRWIEAKRTLASQGLVVKVTVHDSNGNPTVKEKLNPLLKVVENCEGRLLALAQQLGLTPITRDKVKKAAGEELPKAKPGSVWAQHPELFDERGNYIGGANETRN